MHTQLSKFANCVTYIFCHLWFSTIFCNKYLYNIQADYDSVCKRKNGTAIQLGVAMAVHELLKEEISKEDVEACLQLLDGEDLKMGITKDLKIDNIALQDLMHPHASP